MAALGTALFLGISLGFGAGISPGPLLTLVITTTLERGFGAGLRVALAPLVTDVPIVALVLLTLSALPDLALVLLSGVGGLFVIYLGVETMGQSSTAQLGAVPDLGGGEDLLRGALVNVLSPHPWLFWIGVGGPLFLTSWTAHPLNGVAFLVGFYTLLVGCKVVLAWAVGRGRGRLTTPWYRRILFGGGLLLAGMGVLLLVQAAGG
jgi:threonine/homoserine/homoserine lactone efflux protein